MGSNPLSRIVANKKKKKKQEPTKSWKQRAAEKVGEIAARRGMVMLSGKLRF